MNPPRALHGDRPDGPCLDEAAVQRLSQTGAKPSEPEAAHLSACVDCAARLDEARREAAFLGRARGLLGEDLGPIGAPRLTGYRPLGVISTGAQGVVYRAMQESTQRIVAIKVLAAGNAHSGDEHGTASATRRRLRAEREVEIIARLKHPNIVAVHESRTIDNGPTAEVGGRVALVMEYVDGVPLDQWKPAAVNGAPVLPADRLRAVLRVFVEVCEGVHHAHLNGVIHRDLKPDNILVTSEGRPVILDFGIAKLNAVQGLSTTATGDFAGTPAYASPEQVAAKPDEVNALTDVYSLGVILYRLVCGALPYDLGETIFEAARVIGSVEPRRPRSLDASIPRDLEAVIMRALAKAKSSRYQSAAALGRDVERFLAGEPVEARSESGWYLLRKAVIVNRRRLGLVAAAGLVLTVAGAAVWLSLASAADSARLAARRQEDARKEHVRARAVDELLREALPESDPERPELSVLIGRRLSRLYYRLETGAFAEEPDLDQEIRRLWGRVYTGFGSKAATHIEYAEVSLRHGLVRLRLAHKGDNAEIASTLHQLADVLLVRRRYDEAAVVAQDALAMRQRLDGEQSTSVAESRALLARVYFTKGDTDAAEHEAARSLAVLEQLRTPDSELLSASMQALTARIRLKRGDAEGAASLVLAAMKQRLRLLRADDADMIESLELALEVVAAAPSSELGRVVVQSWGDGKAGPAAAIEQLKHDLPLLAAPDRGDYQTTLPAGRTDALGRLVKLQQAVSSDDVALVSTLLLRVESATAEVRYRERAESSLQAAEILARRFGPNHFSVLVCIQDASVALLTTGDVDGAVALTQRGCEFWQSIPELARDQLLAANAYRYHAWALAVAGKSEEAETASRTAIEEFTAAAGPEHHTISLCRAFLAMSLAQRGRVAEAERESGAAMSLALRSKTSPADLLAHVNFIRGHVLLMQPGREREARSHLEEGWKQYLGATTREYAWHVLLQNDLKEVCRRLGDAAGVQEWTDKEPIMLQYK